MKNIVILGSTGSIGNSALEVIRNHSNSFNVYGLATNRSIEKLYNQILEFSPTKVVVFNEEAYKNFLEQYKGKVQCEVLCGMDGLLELVSDNAVDIVLTSVVGSIGLLPTVEALKNNKRVALANKETMVLAGDLINKVRSEVGEIIPVDSEHSAIFQALEGNKLESVSKIYITASGGPFWELEKEKFSEVTVESALKHPRWKMGAKITIDSATLLNKGLEIIEAHYLFNIDYQKIEPVIHRQSIIHSMVEYIDGSIIAQLGPTSMEHPILYAFSYPDRVEYSKKLNIYSMPSLTFEKADYERFPLLQLAIECGIKGEGYPGVLNAANEVAVEAFLNGKISYLDIYKVVYNTVEKWNDNINVYSIDDLLFLDKKAREIAKEIISKDSKI